MPRGVSPGGGKVEFFVVEGRPAVPAGKLGNDEKDARLFEVAVGKANMPGPADDDSI